MDESKLAQVLSCIQNNDNDSIMYATNEIEEQKACNSTQLCLSLLNIIQQIPQLRKLALIILKQTICASWDKIDQGIKNEIIAKIIDSTVIFKNEIEQNVIVEIFIFLMQTMKNEVYDLESTILNTDNNELLEFQLRFLNSVSQKQDLLHIFFEFQEQCKKIILKGLHVENWDLRNYAINCFIVMAPFVEGGMNDYLNVILKLLDCVNILDEPHFISLWNAIDTILEISEEIIPLNEEQIKFIFSSAINALECENLSTTAKAQTLNALSHKMNKFDDGLLTNILNYSFNLGEKIIENDLEYPEIVGDIYRNAIDSAGINRVYPNYIEKVHHSIENPNLDSVVCLFLTKYLMDSISKYVRNDWETYLKLISIANQIGIDFVIQLTCEFIESLNSTFEKQIIEANLFLDYLVPLIVSKSNSLRHHAREAIYKSIDSISVSYKGLTKNLWKVSNQVKDEKEIYLTLLAKSISNECEEIDDNLLIQITEFCQNILCTQEIISGALALASVLLVNFENTHSILLEPTFNIIKYCLESEDDDLISVCLNRLQFLIPYFGNYFNNDFYQKIIGLLTKEDVTIQTKESSLLCASSIAKISNDKELINNIYNFCSEWSKSDDEELIHSAIQSILRIKDVLSPELIYEVSTNIGKMALESNNSDIVTDCVDFIGSLISESKNLKELIHDIGLKLSEAFLSNNYPIFKGKDKMNIQYETLSTFIKLLSDMMIYKDDFCRVIYKFINELIQSDDESLLDLAFNIIYDGIKYNSFIPEEINQIIMVCFVLMQQDIDEDLIQNFSCVLTCLIENNLFSDEQIQFVYQWSIKYWCNLISKRALFGETLTNLAVLQWTLLFMKSNILSFNNEILQQTFEQFPPKSLDDSSKMTDILSHISQSSYVINQFSDQIIQAILRLLVLPTLLIKQKGFSDDNIYALLQIFQKIISIFPGKVDNINLIANGSDVKKNRIQQYLIKM